MKKHLRITFLDKFENEHQIRFRLYDSNIAKRWQNLIYKNKTTDVSYIYSFFINATAADVPEVLTEINLVIEKINITYDRKLKQFSNIDELDQTILNDLHEEYEIYGDRIALLTAEKQFDIERHNMFLRLNELIHTCEEIIDQARRNDEIVPMSALVDYYPQGNYEEVEEIDKIYLSNNFFWGGIYLGYNTLGKDWLEVSRHNDIDVIIRQQVRKQERFSTELWINLTADDTSAHSLIEFEKWYRNLPEDIQNKIPVNNLNDLCLGRIEIGRIVIDNYFLSYHNSIEDWKSLNHKIKDKWNKEVFSTFRKVKDIEILLVD